MCAEAREIAMSDLKIAILVPHLEREVDVIATVQVLLGTELVVSGEINHIVVTTCVSGTKILQSITRRDLPRSTDEIWKQLYAEIVARKVRPHFALTGYANGEELTRLIAGGVLASGATGVIVCQPSRPWSDYKALAGHVRFHQKNKCYVTMLGAPPTAGFRDILLSEREHTNVPS